MFNVTNAANAYASARQAVTPGNAPSSPAIDGLANAAQDFAAQMAQVDTIATGAMTGKVDTHQLVQTITEAELAMETVVSIRDKVVEAYQEILRMPV